MSRPPKNDGKELGPRLFVIQVDPTRVHPVAPKANLTVKRKTQEETINHHSGG